MPISFLTDAGALIIPGGYPIIKVAQSNSGLATTGVLMLVGEADAGPDYSQETDLSLNSFGPDQAADVVAKYKSGPLVDAFNSATAAANDEGIPGTFSRAIVVKTNPSVKAQGTLPDWSGSTWSVIADKSWGKLGNLISYTVEAKQSEVVPTTGAFTCLLPIAQTDIKFRVNGGSAVSYSVAALDTPVTTVSGINALSGVAATGGTDRAIIASVTGTLALAIVAGNAVTVTRSVAWSTTPTIGDTLFISSTSVIRGSSSQNVGSYVVTAATSTTISATKLLDGSGAANALTSPSAVSAVSIASTTVDARCFAPVTVSVEAGDPSDGLGKALEVAEMTSSSGLLTYIAYGLSTTPVTWISKTGAANILTSATEYIPNLKLARQLDSVSEEISAGGTVALALGYLGTTATATISGGTLTIAVTGGSGTSPAAFTLADERTIADLAGKINALTGFSAAAGSAVVGQQLATTLDAGAFGICSQFGGKPGRIKQDAYKFFNAVNNNSVLAQISADGTDQPVSGVPKTQTIRYLTGGTKAGTTDAIFQDAIDSLELVRGNFLVPLFSRNATDDITDGLTDSTSSYTLAAIHSACRKHVLDMSTLKRRRNRQAVLSVRDTFLNARSTASNLASSRCAMTFQDVKDLGSSGVVQFQPWMAAVKAAAMQAAGFYRPIVHKFINISGALQAAGDFQEQRDSDVENALEAGLLPIRKAETGGFYWVSDQTTYGKDSNFVFNSLQATYVGDVIALTTAQRMELAFVGQSVADISASMALMTLEGIMTDLLRLKLIAPSDDAPKGFKNATIKINGPAMIVSLEVKLAGAIYFIPITFSVTPVQQSAG